MTTLRYTPVVELRFPARAARSKSHRYAEGPSRLRRAVQIGRDILLAAWAIGVLGFLLVVVVGALA
jgi:hypothetical protein